MTIGKLASALRISKGGLFAHFGSNEDLQCAVVDEARDIFVEKVVRPAYEFHGLKRLRALCEHWLSDGEKKGPMFSRLRILRNGTVLIITG